MAIKIKMETKIYAENGKKWTLPKVVPFLRSTKQTRHFTYIVVGFRKPRRREYFLSGAVVEAHYTHNDLSQEYLVVKPMTEMRPQVEWVKKN